MHKIHIVEFQCNPAAFQQTIIKIQFHQDRECFMTHAYGNIHFSSLKRSDALFGGYWLTIKTNLDARLFTILTHTATLYSRQWQKSA